MLDFRPRAPVRNYLTRREQRRLLAWVMGIGLVLIAGLSFNQIWQHFREQPIAAADSIDTRFQPPPVAAGEPDSVSIIRSAEVARRDVDRLADDVDVELLGRVRDDTPWIRNDEIDAWLNLWNVLARTSDQEISRQSSGLVGYVELFGQPQAFRGKLVTIRGTARQAVYLKAAENAIGLEGYYRVVLLPAGGPAEPLFLYTLELPRGFPVGEELRAELTATGYFFKRMVYPTKATSELRRAPVVMSRKVTWQAPAAPGNRHESALIAVLVGGTVIGVIGLIATAVWAARAGAPASAQLPANMAAIDDRDVVDIQESLARLEGNES